MGQRKSARDPARTESDAEAGHLYARVAGLLRADIARGLYAIGSVLPSESDLCTRFGVSRHTVREAIGRLAKLGLVARKQGAGTRVVAAAPKAVYVHTLRSLVEVFQYKRDTWLDVAELDLVALDAHAAGIVPASEASRWLRITGVRRTTDIGNALCFSTIYVHGRFAGVLTDVRERTEPIYSMIEERTGEIVAEARQEITAAPLPGKAAVALKLRAGSPAVHVVRRYFDASGGSMLTSDNWHPADLFTYSVRLRRDSND
ncbi:MAG: transcriptional regulator [Rhodospirillales bacterium]|nr:transcriptional regulator [Rhodospirillales bacterium]